MAVSDFTSLDLSLDLETNLINQIAKTSSGKPGTAIVKGDLIFSQTITLGYAGANTATMAGFADPSKFNCRGRFWVYYRRYDLRLALASIKLAPIASATNATDYLAAVNDALGITLTADMVTGSPIVNGQPILLSVKEGNDFYTGSGKITLTDPADTPAADQNLSALLKTTILPGFIAPTA